MELNPRLKTCNKKRTYLTRREAKKALKEFKKRGLRKCKREYFCLVCRHWHLTSQAKVAKLDKRLAPYVAAAKKEFEDSCRAMPPEMLLKKGAHKKIKYFDMLMSHYEGLPLAEVANQNGMNPKAIRNHLADIQNKVLIYKNGLTPAS